MSFRGTPLCSRAAIARTTMSYILLVARSFCIIANVGNHGIRTVAGVVPVSRVSYNFFSRATSAASSAISEHERLRTVVWNISCVEMTFRQHFVGRH